MPYHAISCHIIPCDAIWCQIILANVTTIPIIIMHQYLLFFLKHLFIFFHGQVLPGGVDPSARCLLFFEEIRWAVVRSLPGFFCRFCFCSLNHGGSQLTSFFLSWPVFLPFLLFSLNHGGSQLTRFFRSLPGFFCLFCFFLRSTWEYFRRLMATSLFAWTPIHQQTALSTLLESGSDIPEESNLDVEQKDIHASIHPSMHHLYRDRDIFCRSERI